MIKHSLWDKYNGSLLKVKTRSYLMMVTWAESHGNIKANLYFKTVADTHRSASTDHAFRSAYTTCLCLLGGFSPRCPVQRRGKLKPIANRATTQKHKLIHKFGQYSFQFSCMCLDSGRKQNVSRSLMKPDSSRVWKQPTDIAAFPLFSLTSTPARTHFHSFPQSCAREVAASWCRHQLT